MLTVYSKFKNIAFSTRCSKQNGYDRCDPSCFLCLELEVVIVANSSRRLVVELDVEETVVITVLLTSVLVVVGP